MLHEVQQGGVGVVGGRDGRDLVVLVTGSASPTAVAASALTGVVLMGERERGRRQEGNVNVRERNRIVLLLKECVWTVQWCNVTKYIYLSTVLKYNFEVFVLYLTISNVQYFYFYFTTSQIQILYFYSTTFI